MLRGRHRGCATHADLPPSHSAPGAGCRGGAAQGQQGAGALHERAVALPSRRHLLPDAPKQLAAQARRQWVSWDERTRRLASAPPPHPLMYPPTKPTGDRLPAKPLPNSPLSFPSPAFTAACRSEAYRWVKDRRPVIAITQVSASVPLRPIFLLASAASLLRGRAVCACASRKPATRLEVPCTRASFPWPDCPCLQNDAQRLQAAEAQLMGLNASGFQVPVGQQPAGDGAPGAAPFGWPAFGGGWAGGGAPPAGGALQPGQPPVLNFAGPPSSGAFVFGARQGQQAQQEQQAEMAD